MRKTASTNPTRRYRRGNQRGMFSLLACLVVLATAAALMLPAISATKESLENTGVSAELMVAAEPAADDAAADDASDAQAAAADDAANAAKDAASKKKASNEKAKSKLNASAASVEALADHSETVNNSEDAGADAEPADNAETEEPNVFVTGDDDPNGNTEGDAGDLAGDEADEPADAEGEEADADALVDSDSDPAATDDDPDAMPAQTFTEQLENAQGEVTLTVTVDAPEGAFPAHTTMWVQPVKSQDVKDAVTDAISERTDAKVGAMQAVDITFTSENGEPLREPEDRRGRVR